MKETVHFLFFGYPLKPHGGCVGKPKVVPALHRAAMSSDRNFLLGGGLVEKLDDAAAYLIYKLEKQCWQIGILVEPA